MRAFILVLSLFLTVIAEEKSVAEKNLEKYVGNWDVTVSGNFYQDGQRSGGIHIKGKLNSKFIFGRKVVMRTFSAVNKADAKETRVEIIGFTTVHHKDKDVLRILDFISDNNSFEAYYKVINENQVKTLFEKSDVVKMAGGLEFIKGGDEISASMNVNYKDGQYRSEMNWLNVKSKDKNFAVKHKPVTEKKESLKKFATKDHHWVLMGNYLMKKGKKDEKEFYEFIGTVMQHDVAKVQIFSDGSVKSFAPEKADAEQVKWKEVELVKNYDKLE